MADIFFPHEDKAFASHAIGFHFSKTTFNFSDTDRAGEGHTILGDPTHNIFIASPAMIEESNGFQYSTANYGVLGDLMSLGGAGDNLATLFGGGGVGKAASIPGGGGANMVANLLQRSAGNSIASQMMSASTRTTPNVREEQLFAQPDFRTFTFTFDLFPRSEDEATALNEIIMVMRSASYPDLTADNLRFIFPDEVKVKYYLNWNDHRDLFPRIGKSVVTSFSVNYGAAGLVKVFYDGSPTNVTLTLQIKECQLNNRKTDVIPDKTDQNNTPDNSGGNIPGGAGRNG